MVSPVTAVNGNDQEAAAEAIANCDIMATAVGARILKFIVGNIVAGLRKRWQRTDAPLNIIICENLMDANLILERMLKEQLTEEDLADLEKIVREEEADPADYRRFLECDYHFHSRIYQATSWNAFIEMVHPSVNKAESLRRVCELYGVAREDVMAIGDGGNDAEMIRWAGTGVAMGNARDAVKEAADIVAPPNTEDGAAQIVEAALAAKE